MKRVFSSATTIVAVAATLAATALLTSPDAIAAKVVRPAPDIALASGARAASIRGFKNQPVVVIFARSARDNHFRAQAKAIQQMYKQFANREVLFVAAFTESSSEPIRTSVPFLLAANGAAAASAFGVGNRGVAIISPEGNLDYVSNDFTSAFRIREILINTQSLQAAHRK